MNFPDLKKDTIFGPLKGLPSFLSLKPFKMFSFVYIKSKSSRFALSISDNCLKMRF